MFAADILWLMDLDGRFIVPKINFPVEIFNRFLATHESKLYSAENQPWVPDLEGRQKPPI